MAARSKGRLTGCVQRGAASEGPRQHRTRRSILLRFIIHSEDSLTKPKVAILVPGSPKSSEAIKRVLFLELLKLGVVAQGLLPPPGN